MIGVWRLLRDRLRAALAWPPLVIAAMLVGAVQRLDDEGIATDRIRLQHSPDRRVWRLLVDHAEVFTVMNYQNEVRGSWLYPPEAAHAASSWTEGAKDGEA